MDRQKSLLYSKYVIDGIPQELTPYEMLFGASSEAAGTFATIMDESVDPRIGAVSYDLWKLKEYLSKLSTSDDDPSSIDLPFAAQYTRIALGQALVVAIWKEGHFGLEDLRAKALWEWPSEPIGAAAAFYGSSESAAEYADNLGVSLTDVSVKEGGECCSLSFEVESPNMGKKLRTSRRIVSDPESWIVFIPFDSCQFALGGSLLSRCFGASSDGAPELDDPDYFIDCYEVVREMVEDGVFISGISVGRGGLALALEGLFEGSGAGISVGLRSIMKAYGEDSAVRVLFSEVPGVVVQISDNDFDYIDAEFTLQDIAFFPLGHPQPSRPGLRVDVSDRDSINTILDSLIRSQSSEGED